MGSRSGSNGEAPCRIECSTGSGLPGSGCRDATPPITRACDSAPWRSVGAAGLPGLGASTSRAAGMLGIGEAGADAGVCSCGAGGSTARAAAAAAKPARAPYKAKYRAS